MSKLSQIVLGVILGLCILPSFSYARIPVQLASSTTGSIGVNSYTAGVYQTLGSDLFGVIDGFYYNYSSPFSQNNLAQWWIEECIDSSYSSCVSVSTSSQYSVGGSRSSLTPIYIDMFPNPILDPSKYYRLRYSQGIGGCAPNCISTYLYGTNYDSYYDGYWSASTTNDIYFVIDGIFFDTEPVDDSYINIVSTSSNSGIYVATLNYYLENNLLPDYYIYLSKDGIIQATSSVSYGVIGTTTLATTLLNGYNILEFGFCGLVGCQAYNSVYVNYDGSMATSSDMQTTYEEFYDALADGWMSQWQSVNQTCNFFNAISSSTFKMADCIKDLTLQSTTTLQNNINATKMIFPFNMAVSVYELFTNTIGTKEVRIQGTTPDYLGGTSFDFGLDSDILDWLWYATSTGKYDTASSETFATRVSRYLDPLFKFMFAIYIMSFFFRAFKEVGGIQAGYSRSEKRLVQSKKFKKR